MSNGIKTPLICKSFMMITIILCRLFDDFKRDLCYIARCTSKILKAYGEDPMIIVRYHINACDTNAFRSKRVGLNYCDITTEAYRYMKI